MNINQKEIVTMSPTTYKYVAQIPARIGSKRVQQKNIRILNGKPMIQYAIEACKNVSRIDKIFVNSESDLIGQIAINNEVEYYKRKKYLSGDTIKQDEFNYDFIKNIDSEFIIMVNPVCPLIEPVDIDNAITYYENHNIDTLLSVKKEQLHAFYQEKSLNFDVNELLPATQDIPPVFICCWSIGIWNKKVFIEYYEKNGYATLSGVVGQWVLDPKKSIKISYEEDFLMAEHLLIARDKLRNSSKKDYKLQYYKG